MFKTNRILGGKCNICRLPIYLYSLLFGFMSPQRYGLAVEYLRSAFDEITQRHQHQKMLLKYQRNTGSSNAH